MTEIIPTCAALRITGSKQEIELVLEAMALAGWRCKPNEKLYPYNDRGKLKFSLYVNDLQIPLVGREAASDREKLRSLAASQSTFKSVGR